jgi:hypothetical protein
VGSIVSPPHLSGSYRAAAQKLCQRSALRRVLLAAVALGAVWLAATLALAARPAVALDEASGLYAPSAGDLRYRWTANRAVFPIRGGSGPTGVTLTLGPSRWAGREPFTVGLRAGQARLASFAAPDTRRDYRLLLPPGAEALTLETPVELPPEGDPRWLGVTLYRIEAVPSGPPLRAAGLALLLTLAAALAALALGWAWRRGWGAEAALLALALAPRLAWLDRAPSGWRVDEVVSLVDAWHIAQTGRDHLGHPLPLGALEALGDWISPLLTYLELPLVALFGPERLVGRAVTAVAGALAAPLLYRLARRLELPAPAALAAGALAALSPWQVFLSRTALPPALVPTAWALCLLAALALVQGGRRRDALLLAGAAGLALYSYPTMKMAVPLLVGLGVLLAAARHSWRAARAWWPAAGLLALLWLPFAAVTLLNPASSTRLGQAALRVAPGASWLAAWWAGYQPYFQPGFYYLSGDGDAIRTLPGWGLELPATAPLALLGLALLLWRAGAGLRAPGHGAWQRWLLLAGALLIAPLPASLTLPSPHTYRAAPLAPLYALLCGLGVAALWEAAARLPRARATQALRTAGALALAGALLWQFGGWWRDYTESYPERMAQANQDGLAEAMRLLVAAAPQADEIWISYQQINEPYIYLLAAQPLPPRAAQQAIEVIRAPGRFNDVVRVGRYRFVDPETVPPRLPVLEALPNRAGQPGFVIQRWQRGGRTVLLLRRM